jgi:hypothetical protein
MALMFPRLTESLARARRRATVYVTENSEYHCVRDVCVGVRDLQTGTVVQRHPAVGRRLSAVIRFAPDGALVRSPVPGASPRVGDHLHFSEGKVESEITTSAICEIRRGNRDTVRMSLE